MFSRNYRKIRLDMDGEIDASVVRKNRTTEADSNHEEVERHRLDLVLVPKKSKK